VVLYCTRRQEIPAKHSRRCDPTACSNRPSIHSPFHFTLKEPSREPKKRMKYPPFRPSASSRVPRRRSKLPVIPPADEPVNTELTDCLQTITYRDTIAHPPGTWNPLVFTPRIFFSSPADFGIMLCHAL
jgi:hypothetical protein